MENGPQKCAVPWWDAAASKAFREGVSDPEPALGIIEGPGGIALAVFPDGPQEIPGLTNQAWKLLNSKDEVVPSPKKKAKTHKKMLQKKMGRSMQVNCPRAGKP